MQTVHECIVVQNCTRRVYPMALTLQISSRSILEKAAILLRILGTHMLRPWDLPGGFLVLLRSRMPFPNLLWVTGRSLEPRRFNAFSVEYLMQRFWWWWGGRSNLKENNFNLKPSNINILQYYIHHIVPALELNPKDDLGH